jgi:triacylglycerol lipase
MDNLEQALFCCRVSEIVYNRPPTNIVKLINQHKEINNYAFGSKDGTEYILFTIGNTKYVVFRGTEPNQMEDIKADLKVWKTTSDTEGKVHSGFKNALDLVWNNISGWLQKQTSAGKVIFCGHSLGGALATLAASRVTNSEAYTFGSPKVGNRKWCRKQKFNHYRFVNNNDVVPKVPFFLLGYKHYGNLCYINHYGNIRKPTWWQRTKDSFRGRWAAIKKKQFFDGIYDHNISGYKKKINNVLCGNSKMS